MKHIDNLFREELGNYSEAPPPMVWDALEKRLEGDRGKRAFPYRWMLYCAVISMVLVGSGSLAWKMSNTSGETVAAEAETVEGTTATDNETKASDVKPINEPKTIALNTTNTSAKTVKHHKTRTHKAHTTQTETAAIKKTTSHTAAVTKHVVKKAVAQEAAEANNPTAASDYDYYAAATSGDESAPAPKASTEVDGYVVNVRRKNNIKVADMAPVEEKVAYRKPAEVQMSAENMVMSTMPASDEETEVKHTKHTAARNTSTVATAKRNSAVSQHENSAAKVQASKPSVFASAANRSAVKPATVNTTHNTATSKPIAGNTPAVVKKEQAAVTTVAAKAKADGPIVHKVTSPVENAKAESKAPAKKEIAKVPAKAIVAKQPVASATKVPTQKAVAQKTKPVETPVSSTPASEKKISAATQPTAQKNVATKQVAAIVPSATAGVSKAENKVAAAQLAVKNDKVAEPVAAIMPSATAGVNKPENKVTAAQHLPKNDDAAKQTASPNPSATDAALKPVAKKVTASRHSETDKAAKTKQKKIAKEEVAAQGPTGLSAAAAPTAKTITAKEVKAMKPLTAKNDKEKQERLPIAKEEGKEVAEITGEQIAAVERNEAQKAAKKSAAKQGTTVAKQTAPVATANTFSASNAYAAKKALKPSIFVEDPAVVVMDPFFAAAVLHTVEEAPLPGTFKESVVAKPEQTLAPALTAQPVATVDSNAAKTAAWRNKITGGIKLGVEGTYSGEGARRAVVSPYLEYKVNEKMSFLFQPTLKFSNLRNRSLDGTQTYLKINGDGKAELTGTDTIIVGIMPGIIYDTLYKRNYTYSQSHDSLVKSYGIGGNYFDFDIPLMMKYQLSKKFSVYGGVNLSFHKLSINTNTYNSGPIVVKADSFTVAKATMSAPAEPPVSSVIRYGTSTTAPQALYAQPKGELNLGYMIGISYEFRRRCLFDALIHQGFAKTNEVGGYNINTAFSMPYLRLTVGYRLMK